MGGGARKKSRPGENNRPPLITFFVSVVNRACKSHLKIQFSAKCVRSLIICRVMCIAKSVLQLKSQIHATWFAAHFPIIVEGFRFMESPDQRVWVMTQCRNSAYRIAFQNCNSNALQVREAGSNKWLLFCTKSLYLSFFIRLQASRGWQRIETFLIVRMRKAIKPHRNADPLLFNRPHIDCQIRFEYLSFARENIRESARATEKFEL